MLGKVGTIAPKNPTFDSPKVAKARLPFPYYLKVMPVGTVFLFEVVTF
jgi:hypothetical protein